MHFTARIDEGLILALPNNGLQAKTAEFLNGAGITVPVPGRQHSVEVDHFLVKKVLWLKARAIPWALACGMAHIGLTGEDCHEEWTRGGGRERLEQLAKFCYGKSGNTGFQVALVCSSLSRPPLMERGMKVITDYPNWTPDLIPCMEPVPSDGSLESFIPWPFEAGITVVETGVTLKQNNLRVLRVLAECGVGLYVASGIDSDRRYKISALAGLLIGVAKGMGLGVQGV